MEWEDVDVPATAASSQKLCRLCHAVIPPPHEEGKPPICPACAAKPGAHLDEPSSPNTEAPHEWARQQRATVHAYTSALVEILSEISQSLHFEENSLEFETRAAVIWKKIGELRHFLEAVVGHGEVILDLEQMVTMEGRQRFSHDKARALQKALGILEHHAALAHAILERVNATLRAGGFDVSFSSNAPHASA